MFDHTFVFIFAVAYPIAGFIGFRRLLKRIEAGIAIHRNRLYVSTIIWHWSLFVLALIVWSDASRSWAELGFGLALNFRFLIGAGISIAGIALLVAQIRQVGTVPHKALARVTSESGAVLLLVPRNGSELARFNVLSITAGIVEETLWRGFLIWYLSQFMPVWSAAIISAVGFGIAHGYQGLAKVPRIMLVAAVFAGLFVLTGSLWLAIILHAAVDLLQGRLAYEVLRRIDQQKDSAAEADVQTLS